MDRRELIAAERQEPQETRADADFRIVGIHPAPLLALVAGEDSIEVRTQRVGIGLEPVREICSVPARSLHMPDKLIEEAAKHARLRLDLLPHLLRQVERIAAQERSEPLVIAA